MSEIVIENIRDAMKLCEILIENGYYVKLGNRKRYVGEELYSHEIVIEYMRDKYSVKEANYERS